MYTIEIKHFFQAAHQLTDSEDLFTKECSRPHGHSYCVIVKINVEELNKASMVIDFKAIKRLIDDAFDHKNINEVFRNLYSNVHIESTAENIAKTIYSLILEKYLLKSIVSVAEGYKGSENTSWVTYSN